MLSETNLEKEFKFIAPLTFINLSFFIENVHNLTSHNQKFYELLKKYHLDIKQDKIKYNKNRTRENLFNSNKIFEETTEKLFGRKNFRSKDYVSVINKALEIAKDQE